MEDTSDDPPRPTTYPVPEAIMAGDPTILAAVAAAIIGVLAFWRKKQPRQDTRYRPGREGSRGTALV